MKTLSYSIAVFFLTLATSPALAVTCQVLEADGVAASGRTKLEAEKAAWKACIGRKIAIRERSRGSVDVDTALEDAEPCLNAKMKCQ